MKKINMVFGIVVSSLLFFSCDKNENIWEEEQYKQYVSFKAPMNNEGCTPVYIRYKPEGKVTYKLPVIISGSTVNEKTRHIHFAEDRDTLITLNDQRFGPNRPEWWYEPLEKDKFYTFNDELVMEKGCSLSSLDIEFTLNGIDMTRKWVVPLTIVNDPSYDYRKHPRKHFAKAVLRVWPFNDFSGKYSTSTMEVYFRDPKTDKASGIPMVENRRTAYVVDENTVFFYAGLMNEEMKVENRQKYKVFVRFLGADSENEADKKLEIWTDGKNEMNFELKTVEPRYSTAEIPDVTRPYLLHKYVTFDIEYNFNDVTTTRDADGKVVPIYYKVKGTLILERNVNTQIPDEDQAIEW